MERLQYHVPAKVIKGKIQRPAEITAQRLQPVVLAFLAFIEGNGEICAAFNQMFNQAPPPIDKKKRQVYNYGDLMQTINTILGSAPIYSTDDEASAMAAAVPYYAVISRFCNTVAGYNAFTHPGVNRHFQAIFTQWYQLLQTTASTNVINDGKHGWLSVDALKSMVTGAGGDYPKESFEDYYVCDVTDPHYGYKSFDELFIRELKASKRSVILPDDPSVVNAACSCDIVSLYHDLKKTDKFWIKNTPYSLSHILGHDELTSSFIGGTLFQGLLRSTYYHRWRSPVKGVVKKTRLIAGSDVSKEETPPTYLFG
ncbi:hypothetical protein ID866_11075 [Astraeus odoratus]|nr:hypothetical protein ID866_11075 [Astraeus odoratus]